MLPVKIYKTISAQSVACLFENQRAARQAFARTVRRLRLAFNSTAIGLIKVIFMIFAVNSRQIYYLRRHCMQNESMEAGLMGSSMSCCVASFIP
jgi:hypothetical protein